MPKYIENQEPIEAYPFTEDMTECWYVHFSGCLYPYDEYFNTKQEADDFIKNNKGVNMLYNDDKDSEIEYNAPVRLITLDNLFWDVKVGDYIVIDSNGKKFVMDKVKFEKKYKLVEE